MSRRVLTAFGVAVFVSVTGSLHVWQSAAATQALDTQARRPVAGQTQTVSATVIKDKKVTMPPSKSAPVPAPVPAPQPAPQPLPPPPPSNAKPPAGGYFQLRGAGSFAQLPGDTQAAALVKRSTWEPRPVNAAANATIPPQPVSRPGYEGMLNYAALFGRVSGNFTGTTDEIIQWTATKWGLPDEVIRAAAVVESQWYQNEKVNGVPVRWHGYGDYGSCGGAPAASGYGVSGPASYGIIQVKYCSHPNTWPHSELSTAYNLDYYGAVMRGCVEGWDSWLKNGYAAGDLWGCVGRWYAGEWYSAGANEYIAKVKAEQEARRWLSW